MEISQDAMVSIQSPWLLTAPALTSNQHLKTGKEGLLQIPIVTHCSDIVTFPLAGRAGGEVSQIRVASCSVWPPDGPTLTRE